jgi:uncharacterized membrane protein YjjB (DUF3815 family)
MAQPAPPREGGIVVRLVIGLVLLFLAWVALKIVLNVVFSMVRTILFVGLIALVVWLVLAARSDSRK